MKPPLYIPDEALGVTQEQARDKVVKGKAKWTHFTPTFVGTQVPRIDLAALGHQIAESQTLYAEARTGQANGTVRIRSTLPIRIHFLGDLHYGSVYTDYAEIARQIERIKTDPLTYVCFMSNLIDNAIPSTYPANMLVNACPPDKQVIAMRRMLEELNALGKVLGAVTSPCHEG